MATYAELQRHLDWHRVKWFKAEELAHVDIPEARLWPNIIPTVRAADLLRDEFGTGRCHSGYRSPRHNLRVGGSTGSMHLYFNAMDLSFARGRPGDWADYIRDRLGLWVSAGIYPTFLHVDTRAIILGRAPWHN